MHFLNLSAMCYTKEDKNKTHTIQIQGNVLFSFFYMINLPDPTLHELFQVVKIDF